jgi:hypothetical protein
MGLFEKLQAMASTPAPAIPPCECGAGLQGECPECTPAEPEAGSPEVEKELDQLELQKKLKALGDKKLVNPPKPAPAAVPAPALAVPAPAPAVPTPVIGEVCPNCHKLFKHLSRHKRCAGPAAAPDPVPAAPAPDPVPAPEPTPTPAPAGYILLLDALFEKSLGVEVLRFSDVIAPLASAVAEENEQPHWGAVEYGRGGPLLAAKFERWLVATAPQGVIVADSSTPELRHCKELLKKHARVVIVGIR